MNLFLPPYLLREKAVEWLSEDIHLFDMSSIFISDNETREAYIYGKSPGMIAGIPFVNEIFASVNCTVGWKYSDGDIITPLAGIGIVIGAPSAILHAERTALNLLSKASGIATKANSMKILQDRHSWGGIISGTRKTTPGFRIVEKYALQIGGISMHRNDLSSQNIILKDNHLFYIKEKGLSLSEVVLQLRHLHGPFILIEIELSSRSDLELVINARPDIIMLDNFTPTECKAIAREIKIKCPAIHIEASGGIKETDLVQYFDSAIDIISCGSLTTFQSPIDFSLKFEKFGPFIENSSSSTSSMT